MFGYAGWYSKQPYRDILFYVPFQQIFLLPPVLYFYVKALLDKSFQFTKRDYIHFLPSAVYLIYALVVFITDKVVLNEYYFYEDGKDKDFSSWYQITGLCSLGYYLAKSIKTYYQYRTMTYNAVSFADSVMFKWAKRFLLAFLMLIAIRVLFFILNPEWDEFGKKFWYYVCFSVLFYYMSISGYTNSMLSATSFRDFPLNSDVDVKLEADDPTDIALPKSMSEHHNPAEEKQPIPNFDLWREKVEALMLVDKMYENQALVISDLANKLDTHSKKISQVINQAYNMNFNDFVNHYRIKAIIQKIEEGEHNMQTLLSLAFECGFNSKSTFNRAFKRATSLNPKEYIEKHIPK